MLICDCIIQIDQAIFIYHIQDTLLHVPQQDELFVL